MDDGYFTNDKIVCPLTLILGINLVTSELRALKFPPYDKCHYIFNHHVLLIKVYVLHNAWLHFGCRETLPRRNVHNRVIMDHIIYLIERNCVSFLFILPVVGKFDAFHLVIATRSVVPFFLYSGNVVFPCRRGTSVNILHHNTRNPNAHCTPQLHGLSSLTSIKRNQ